MCSICSACSFSTFCTHAMHPSAMTVGVIRKHTTLRCSLTGRDANEKSAVILSNVRELFKLMTHEILRQSLVVSANIVNLYQKHDYSLTHRMGPCSLQFPKIISRHGTICISSRLQTTNTANRQSLLAEHDDRCLNLALFGLRQLQLQAELR